MIDHLMFKLGQAVIGFQRIGVERGANFHMLADFSLAEFSSLCKLMARSTRTA
jgi:hypothetical protein